MFEILFFNIKNLFNSTMGDLIVQFYVSWLRWEIRSVWQDGWNCHNLFLSLWNSVSWFLSGSSIGIGILCRGTPVIFMSKQAELLWTEEALDGTAID